jgi:hypothetical protein
MTQKFHWLAALALLLAFGANAVRAEEEEEEVAPPAQTSVQLLPAPKQASAAPCCQNCCPSCACDGKCCAQAKTVLPAQYVVRAKLVNASADGDCDEVMTPNVTVFAGQTASVGVHDEPTWTERHDINMQIHVTKPDARLHLDLEVEQAKMCDKAPAGSPKMAITRVATAYDLTPGKMKRLVLEKNADGSDASWVEVTVTEIAPQEEKEDSPLDCIGEVVDDLIDTVADVATSLFGDDEPREPVQAVEYRVPVMAPCPSCKKCVAVEAVKTPVKKIRIVMTNGQKCVECSDGDKSWKMTADRITVRDGNLDLEGNLHVVSNDGDGKIVFDKGAKVSLKAIDLEIQIGD